MKRLEFRSVLCALRNVEPWALAEACPSITEDDQRRMAVDPVKFFLKADEEQNKALWRLLQPLTRVSLVTAEESFFVYGHAAE